MVVGVYRVGYTTALSSGSVTGPGHSGSERGGGRDSFLRKKRPRHGEISTNRNA